MHKIRCLVYPVYCSPIIWIFLLLFISLNAVGQSIDFSLPLEKMRITSPYGFRVHPIKLKPIHHNGVDLAARGSPIFNIISGYVVNAGESPTLGKFLVIESGDDIQVIYGHLSRLMVQKGECVPPGHLLGISGRTGLTTGEHLHLSVKIRGQFIDPILFLKKLNEFSLNPLKEQKNE